MYPSETIPAAESVSLNSVSLKAYDGPLDLLLSLIKKNKINIYDIPIIEITNQYLKAIGLNEDIINASFQGFNLDSGGDFIVMAAQLIFIKSLMLLPSYDKDTNTGNYETDDPRTELADMLIEYQRVKEIASFLNNRPILGRDVFEISIFNNKDTSFGIEQEKYKEPLFEANIFILSEYFYYKITEADKRINTYEVTRENFLIKDKIIEIMEGFNVTERTTFTELVKSVDSEDELFTYFLALLEMSRLILINLDQPLSFGDIHISPAAGSSVLNYKLKIANIM